MELARALPIPVSLSRGGLSTRACASPVACALAVSAFLASSFLPGSPLAAGALEAQERPHAFVGARILPVTGAEIPSGTLIAQGGRITAVGASDEIALPPDAVVHSVEGKVLMPGLVDSHSHIGGGDGGDASGAIHGEVRILDALNPLDDRLRTARAGGLTTVNIMPGSGHLMSGQTAYVKLRYGRRIEDMLICTDPLGEICGGMKMANGTNPMGNPTFPQTRARAAAVVRARFQAALEYREKVAAAGDDASRLPPRDLQLEALAQILDGTRMVHFHTHRHDDILTAIRLSEEFGFRVVLHHVSDGWLAADAIAEAGVGSSIILVDSPGGKLEAMNADYRTGAALERAGAQVGFHTDDGISDSRFFLRQAAVAVRAGMSREAALRAMTIENARMMDLGDRVGSLEVGKDADFIVLSGDPLSAYTRVEESWIEGIRVFDLDDPIDRAYAVGGYGLIPISERIGLNREGGR